MNEKMDGITYRPTICVPVFLSSYQEHFLYSILETLENSNCHKR